MHFAKSECPTPKQRMIDETRKGHTQARFFSRKNSNSNQNIMLQSQNGSILNQPNAQYASNGSQGMSNAQSRHNFSPQQQQQMKLQKQLA
jgi:hypothetical protein